MNKPISQAAIIGRSPPTTWQELSRDCQSVFGGGHRDDEEHLGIFHHGIRAVFNLLEGEFPPLPVCKRAAELEAAVGKAREAINRYCSEICDAPSGDEKRECYPGCPLLDADSALGGE